MKLRSLLLCGLGIISLSTPVQATELLLWQFNRQQNRLDIKTDDDVQPKAQLVANPTRIVIDLPGIRWGKPKVDKPVGGAIQAVRVGQFNPQTTRLVIQLAPGYTLNPSAVTVKGASANSWFVQLPAPERERLPAPDAAIATSPQDPISLPVIAPPPETFGGLVSPGRQLTWLQERLAAYQARYPAFKSSMFFLDAASGDFADLNGTQVFPAASIIKLPVLIAFFQAVDAGQVRFDETLVMRPELMASGSGEMQFLRPWTKFSALHTATQMSVISDNTATNMIIKRLGGASVLNQRFRSWGLQKTVIRNWLPDLRGTNTTTAKELVYLMTQLDRGKLLSPQSREQAFEILRRTKNRKLLAAGIGPGAVIAHKTGDIGFMLGDAGMVQMPNGKRYMAAVLAKTPYDDPKGWDFMREVSRIVYTYMGNSTTTALESSLE